MEPAICTTCEPRGMLVIALFGPTGVGKTAVAVALAELLRARGEDPVAVSADALQVYAGLETLTGVASPAEQAQLEHRLSRSCRSTPPSAPASTPSSRTPRSTACSPPGAARSWSAAPACTCARRWPSSTCARRRRRACASAGTAELERARRAGAARAARRTRAVGGRRDRPQRPPARRARARAARPRRARAARGPSQLWSRELRHPTLLVGPDDGARGAVRAHRRARRADARRGRPRGGARAHAAGASETARKALGFEELLAGDVEGMKRRTRNYAKRQLTWMRKLAGVRADRRRRGPDDVAGDPRAVEPAGTDP